MAETKDNSNQDSYPVVIIGGGPAGIATGLTLNALGIPNCIVEASKTPRHKFGEAIPPNAKPLLKQLDMMALIEDDHHIEYYGNKSCWGSNDLEQKEFFSEIHGHGYLLDRAFFEKQLWDLYIDIGGKLLNGFKLNKISNIDNGYALTTSSDNQSLELRCNIVVDATGRKASVCRHFGIKKIKLDDQFALSLVIPTQKTLEHQITVEATKNGWWYAAPDKKNQINLMFFTLKNLIPAKSEVITFLEEELKSSLHLSKIISPSCFSQSDIKIMPAGTSRLKIPYGENWVAVGDAAFSYDPISSYGITSALASGYYAGQALGSKISGKHEAMDAYRYVLEKAFQAYCVKLDAHYGLEQRWVGSSFWRKSE